MISKPMTCDLAVIGAGMTGMAASLFAANRGLNVVQIGRPKGILLSSGLMDLLGVHPMAEKKTWKDPWAAMKQLTSDIPRHPYTHLKKEHILRAFTELFDFLSGNGLPYCCCEDQNSRVLTALGTVKTTYGVPKTMWNGVPALEEKRPTLLVDFHGLKDYSARRIMYTQKPYWPGLRAVRIAFPGKQGGEEFFAGEITAWALERPEVQQQLITALQPHVAKARFVGVPSILGLRHSHNVLEYLEKALGKSLFEIPTIPPSVPGQRLKETFETGLQGKGVRMLLQNQVQRVDWNDSKTVTLHVEGAGTGLRVQARGVILATGRFMGGGLLANRKGIFETLLNLPVFQPKRRNQWHGKDLFDSQGHPVNQAGIETDQYFHPLKSPGTPHDTRLFAAGSILAHQDWMRMKCGSGLAVATAYGAVNAFSKYAKFASKSGAS